MRLTRGSSLVMSPWRNRTSALWQQPWNEYGRAARENAIASEIADGIAFLASHANERPYEGQGAVAVERFTNGMAASALISASWTKSSHSNATGN